MRACFFFSLKKEEKTCVFGPSLGHIAMAAAGVGGGGDHDLPIEEVDAVLASFCGDPAAVFAPLPAPEAEAGASRELLAAGEGLGEVEKFLMEDYEDEAGVDADADGV